jgi:hypothetical protein
MTTNTSGVSGGVNTPNTQQQPSSINFTVQPTVLNKAESEVKEKIKDEVNNLSPNDLARIANSIIYNKDTELSGTEKQIKSNIQKNLSDKDSKVLDDNEKMNVFQSLFNMVKNQAQHQNPDTPKTEDNKKEFSSLAEEINKCFDSVNNITIDSALQQKQQTEKERFQKAKDIIGSDDFLNKATKDDQNNIKEKIVNITQKTDELSKAEGKDNQEKALNELKTENDDLLKLLDDVTNRVSDNDLKNLSNTLNQKLDALDTSDTKDVLSYEEKQNIINNLKTLNSLLQNDDALKLMSDDDKKAVKEKTENLIKNLDTLMDKDKPLEERKQAGDNAKKECDELLNKLQEIIDRHENNSADNSSNQGSQSNNPDNKVSDSEGGYPDPSKLKDQADHLAKQGDNEALKRLNQEMEATHNGLSALTKAVSALQSLSSMIGQMRDSITQQINSRSMQSENQQNQMRYQRQRMR